MYVYVQFYEHSCHVRLVQVVDNNRIKELDGSQLSGLENLRLIRMQVCCFGPHNVNPLYDGCWAPYVSVVLIDRADCARPVTTRRRAACGIAATWNRFRVWKC